MTDVRITQCPKCETTFRVSPAQLKVAKGAVRCGACLNVFKAAEHFQEQSSKVPPKQDDRTSDMFTESNTASAKKSVAKTQTTPPKKAAKASTPVESTIEETAIHDDMDDDLLISDDSGLLIDDESGLDLIDDGEEHETNFANDLNEEFLSLDANNKSADPFYSDSDKVDHEFDNEDNDDESWAEALLNDDEPEAFIEPVQAAPDSAPVRIADQKSSRANDPDLGLDADLSEAADFASMNDIPVQAETPASQFQYIQADPLELSLPDQRARRMRWVWLGLSLLASIALCIQLAYFHFEQWARDPQLRPWYQIACDQLQCSLPPIYDLKQVRTTATPRVSTHPSFENALSVDILFMNHAKYSQPFPVLQLTFTDSQGKSVAQRAFQPVEYLAGEAAGMEMMPSQVPIHIALEIKDPGPKADNYQVSFLNAE